MCVQVHVCALLYCTWVVFALLLKYLIKDKDNVEDEYDNNNTSTHSRCKYCGIKYYLLYKDIEGRMMEAMSGDGCGSGAQLKDSIHPLRLR